MTSPACLPASMVAAAMVAIAAPRAGLSPAPWSARAKARMLRVATGGLSGLLAVALALSLVGVNGEAADRLPAMQIGVLASLAIAAFLVWRSRGSRSGPHSGSGAEPL